MRLVCLILLCFYSSQAITQAKDSSDIHLRYLASGSLNSTGDGKTWLTNNALNLNLKKYRSVLNFNAAWIYSNFNHELTNNDFNALVDFNLYWKDRRFYYWGLAAFDKSYSLKIINRFQSGIGLAYNILRSAAGKLNLSDGLIYEYGDLYENDTTRDTYNTVRNSFRLSYRFNIKNIIIIDGQHFYQNSLLEGDDYIIKSTSTLAVPIKKWISLTASLLYNKTNRTHRENFLLSYGIEIDQHF